VEADHGEHGQRPDPVEAGRTRVRLRGFAWFHRAAMLTIAQPRSQQQRRTSRQIAPLLG
jgi:hypothetical protein